MENISINLTEKVIKFKSQNGTYPIKSIEKLKIVIDEVVTQIPFKSIVSNCKINKNGSISCYSLLQFFEINSYGQLIISKKPEVLIHFIDDEKNIDIGIENIRNKLIQTKDKKISIYNFIDFINTIVSESKKISEIKEMDKNFEKKREKDITNEVSEIETDFKSEIENFDF